MREKRLRRTRFRYRPDILRTRMTPVDVWVLRAILASDQFQSIVEEPWVKMYYTDDDRLADLDSEGELEDEVVLEYLAGKLAELEKQDLEPDTIFDENVDLLGEAMGLDDVEQDVLRFGYHLDNESGLQHLMRNAGRLSVSRLARVMSGVIGRSEHDLTRALGREGTLQRTGLLNLCFTGRHDREKVFGLMSGLDDLMLREYRDVEDMLDRIFPLAEPTTLTGQDFLHLETDVELLAQVLGKAVDRGLLGVNVLLHGPTGTGKTELARVLSHLCGATLYKVDVMDDDSDMMSATGRLTHYRLAQRILAARGRHVILFDEAEDLFPSQSFGMWGHRMETGHGKGFINQLLETNPVPAIWVTNRVWQIDEAYLRRFRHVLEVPTPPRTVRRRMLEARLAGLGVSGPWLDRMAACDQLVPGDIERAAWMARLAGDDAERTLENTLRSSLAARGITLRAQGRKGAAGGYDLDWLNASENVRDIVAGLDPSSRCTLLLHGPPGTGKSALAQHLADRLGMPLCLRRASDLMSCWVGETEKNIASMFREATAQKAVLLLDEADSFIHDRIDAVRSWETTRINELLTQMECFEGIFVCTTNLADRLDQASFRRFDIKVRFDYLTCAQACGMFLSAVESMGLAPPTEAAIRTVESLGNLTPGDFATVQRKLGVLARSRTTDAVARALKDECEAKKDGKVARVAGFGGRGRSS